MKLITTHETTDFDGLASCVALQKLLPGSIIGLSGGSAVNVHQYLALHGDRFHTERCQDLDLDAVGLLAVVDVRSRSRLPHVESIIRRAVDGSPSVRLVVWDHHPVSVDDLRPDEEHVQPVGAATTLLVEELRARDIDIDVEEATLFALGIHEDTGSLAYSRAGSRDANALGWLLGRGARSELVQRFLRPPFDLRERELVVRLLEEAGPLPGLGPSIGLAALEIEEAPASLARVSSEAFRILSYDALFCAYRLPSEKTHVIARAHAGSVPIGEVLEELGGGGHEGAGSAVVREVPLDEVVARLRSVIERRSPRPSVVRDLMSSPVRTVTPDTPLMELASSLAEWQHTGAPVLRDGSIVGIISRRDIERARRDGHCNLAVKSCMAHRVHTIGPHNPLTDALERMKEHNVGRLPVVDDGRVVGIISRRDLLRHLYETSTG